MDKGRKENSFMHILGKVMIGLISGFNPEYSGCKGQYNASGLPSSNAGISSTTTLIKGHSILPKVALDIFKKP